MTDPEGRRQMLTRTGLAVAAGAASLAGRAAQAGTAPALLPGGATDLQALGRELAASPRRRDFTTVPMILETPDQWDDTALGALRAYRGGPRQVWDNSAIGSPWLNLMRNALNTQIWSFRHANFLCVSGTHGSAHLALYDQAMWDKYGLATLAGTKFPTNRLIVPGKAAEGSAAAIEAADGVYSGADNSIPVLMRRGVVFLACHNAIWELSGHLIETGHNPDRLSHPALAAELTNHLIPGAVLTPGIVGTIPELQQAGYHYAYAH